MRAVFNGLAISFLAYALLCSGCATSSGPAHPDLAHVRRICVAKVVSVPEAFEFPVPEKGQVKAAGAVDAAAAGVVRSLFKFEQVDPEHEIRSRTDIDTLLRETVVSCATNSVDGLECLAVVARSDDADAMLFLNVNKIGLSETAFYHFSGCLDPYVQITAILVQGAPTEAIKTGEPEWIMPAQPEKHPVLWRGTSTGYGTWRPIWMPGHYFRTYMYKPEVLRKSLRADVNRACGALAEALGEAHESVGEKRSYDQ